MTPVEVDTELAALHAQHQQVQRTVEQHMHSAPGAYERTARGRHRWLLTPEQALEALEAAASGGRPFLRRSADGLKSSIAEQKQVETRIAELNSVFQQAGGWTRAFLVRNVNGHVHKSMDCSTCNRTGQATQFVWLPDLSGQTEDEIVAAAGWRACTVCSPDAPVGTLAELPSRISAPGDEQREAAREASKAARIAKSLTPDGSELRVTVRGAAWNGPAIEHADGAKLWYQNDRLYRADGPAVEPPHEPGAFTSAERSLLGDTFWG